MLEFLALGTKTQWWGQHEEATRVSAFQNQVKEEYDCRKKNQINKYSCMKEESKLYFQKGERKDIGAKKKLYKLLRGYQKYQAQPKLDFRETKRE